MRQKSFTKIVITIILGILVSFILLVIMLLLIQLTLWIGYYISSKFGVRFATINPNLEVSSSDFFYHVLQNYNVIISTLFTSLLVYFAMKDFIDKNYAKFKVDFRVSRIIQIVINHDHMFIHFPLSVVNLSKRSGFIEDIVVILRDENRKLIGHFESAYLVKEFKDYELKDELCKEIYGRYGDGMPFCGLPLAPEQSVKEIITFRQIDNRDYVLKMKYKQKYYISISYKYKQKTNSTSLNKVYSFTFDSPKAKERIEDIAKFKAEYTNNKVTREILDKNLKSQNRIDVKLQFENEIILPD